MPITNQKEPTIQPIKSARLPGLATLLLELRTEYERRPRTDLLVQIKERASELNELAESLPVAVPNNSQPPALPNTLG